MKANRHHEYRFYRFSFNQFNLAKTPRNINAIKQADVVIIPTEAEFTYWVPGKLHSLSVKRSNEEVAEIGHALEGKRVILLRSDRADSVDLYKSMTWGCPGRCRNLE